MKAEVKKFHKLLDAGKIPSDFKEKYENKFLVSRILESIESGIPPFMVATRFKYKNWNAIIDGWDEVIDIANDSQTVWQLFRLYCFEKIDRNPQCGVNFDKFIELDAVKSKLISHVDDVVTKYQSTWHTDVIFDLLAGLVSDYDKKKLGGVHTPLVLIREMFDKMPDVWGKGLVLDPACGNGPFLWETKQRCIANGCDEKTVVEDILLGIDIDRKKAYITSAVLDPNGLYETRIVLANSLNFLDMEIWKMKFDIIVGNPPYQDSSKTERGGSTLWAKFINKSIDLLNDNGFLSFVTPDAWMSFQQSGKQMKPYQLHTVMTTSVKQHFDMGSTFSAWVLEKTPIYKETNFVDEDDFMLNIRTVDSLPVGRPMRGIPIIEKVMANVSNCLTPKLEQKLSGGWSARQETFINGLDASLTKTTKYKYEVFHTNSLTYFVAEEPTDYYKPKIVISVSSPTPTLYMKHIGCASGDLRTYIVVNDKKDGDNIISYLNSKLYRFVWRRPGMVSWKSFCMPKLANKKWTDAELYKHFNLTQDEIDIVEQTNI